MYDWQNPVDSRAGLEALRGKYLGHQNISWRAASYIVNGCVMSVYSVTLEQLMQPSRGDARIALARQVAMYLSHVTLGMKMADAAAHYNRDRTTASYACKIIEDRRDNRAFDFQICMLEEAILASLTRIANSFGASRDGHGVLGSLKPTNPYIS